MPSDNIALEEIKSRLDIVDVISEYIPLKRTGQNWRGLCPFHAEKTPSFMVSPSKQIYHCFGCGTGGDIFTFLLKYENLSFQEALNVLAEKAGVTLKKFQKNTAKTGEKESILNSNKDALIFYQDSLVKNQKAGRYLAGRGINSKAQKLFFVGYAADSWDALFSYLQKKGYKAEEIKKSGLIARGTKNYYDVFRNRIIFPIFNMRGEVVAFGGRVMDDSMPKYLNSPETPIFNKSRTLYGISHAKESIKKTGIAILVEGYLDVITAHMYGFSNTVAPLGTALTQDHGKLIKRFAQEVILVFDGDSAGIKAAKNGIGVLLESGLNIRVLPLPDGEDPDSYLRKKGKEAFSDLLEKAVSIVDFLVMHAGKDLQQKGNEHLIAREALEIISRIPDSVLQGYHVRQLSERLRINENFIREELLKMRKRLRHNGVRDKRNAKPADIQARPQPAEEVYLLQLLLQCPEKADEIFDSVSADDIKGPVTRAIYEKMKTGLVHYNTLLKECSDEGKAFLTELSFKTEFEDPEKILKDCLNRFKSKKQNISLRELQDRIKEAESGKDGVRLKSLLLEKQRLLKSQ
jgi:DNA primase